MLRSSKLCAEYSVDLYCLAALVPQSTWLSDDSGSRALEEHCAMGLVGMRPPTENEVAEYDEHHHRRLSMKPGLTGLWQLNGNVAVKDFEHVVKLDCEYIDNWSLWLDAKILAKTVTKVIRGNAS